LDCCLTGRVFMVYSSVLGEFCGVAFKQASFISNNRISLNFILLLKLKQRPTSRTDRQSSTHLGPHHDQFPSDHDQLPAWFPCPPPLLPFGYILTDISENYHFEFCVFFGGFYAVWNGCLLPMFRYNLSVLSSRVKQSDCL
jgi:hypothetical protein